MIGYRMWQVRGPVGQRRLAGIHPLTPASWDGRILAASCLARAIGGRTGRLLRPCAHSPSARCPTGCGIAAYASPDDISGVQVTGVVRLGGEIIDVEPRGGWGVFHRAERAEILALSCPSEHPYVRDFLEQFAAEHAIPLIDTLHDWKDRS